MKFRGMSVMQAFCAAGLLVAAMLVHAAEPAVRQPQVDTPKRVLFVGNSYLYYNNSMHNHVRRLALAADPDVARSFQYKSATIGGAPLHHHDMAHLTTPGNLGIKEPFELVIMHGNSTDALADARRAAFRDKAVEFGGLIAGRGGKVALYMTPAHIKPSKAASPGMMAKTADMYVSVGNEIGALVIPAGLAFEEAYRRRPDIRLHQDYDGSHPTVLGTYLAACTIYASVYAKPCSGNSYDYYGRVSREDADFLQKVADETVRKFYGR
ncbi:MAG: hypothetical protein KF834_09565 [Burkholderiales bacterium]|nr:hypothetical protein [Burkholderiales bacterium]